VPRASAMLIISFDAATLTLDAALPLMPLSATPLYIGAAVTPLLRHDAMPFSLMPLYAISRHDAR